MLKNTCNNFYQTPAFYSQVIKVTKRKRLPLLVLVDEIHVKRLIPQERTYEKQITYENRTSFSKLNPTFSRAS
jgi:hypothetical protein